MFKFFKLRNSVSGDARRHVPFTSIIHKPLFLIFALLFSLVCIVPVKVSAAAPQIRPQFKPILDTDIVNFQDSYLQLDPAAQAAASLLFGAYVTEYAGLADYGYVFDSVPTEASFKERLIFMGDQIVDTIFLPVNMADQLVLTPLINLGQGIINKVKGVTNVDDFYDDILDASDYGLSYTPDIGFALNQLFARNGGLYNWQFATSDWSNLSFTSTTLSGATADVYSNYVSTLVHPSIMYHTTYGNYLNTVTDNFGDYYLFFNTTTKYAYLCDEFGNEISSSKDLNYVTIDGSPIKYIGRAFFNHIYFGSDNRSYSNIVNDYFTRTSGTRLMVLSDRPGGGDWFAVPLYNLFVKGVYSGPSWGNKTEVLNNTDLGFADTDSLQVLNPVEEAIFDLKQLVQQIVNNQSDPNLEIPLKPIVYNVTNVNGSPLTAEDLEGLSFNVTPPESGIDVPANAFLPMFDNGKGFISYMWYMTKPLITYTRSLLDALTFDPVNGFNASGPGYFILGVAGLGLIGGVIVKFLL